MLTNMNKFPDLFEQEVLDVIAADDCSDIYPETIPDFMSGMLFAITGDNLSGVIPTCYTPLSPDRLQSDVCAGMNLLSKGTITSAIKSAPFFIDFMKKYPPTIKSPGKCFISGLDEDEA